jgi:hypothetical protein
VAAASFVVNNSSQITAVSPPGTGTVNVTVTTPSGTSALTPADQFTYTQPISAPTITNIHPKKGPKSGGTTVTIEGTNFIDVKCVLFGNKKAECFTVDSPTQITVVSPPGKGTVNIRVVTAQGKSKRTEASKFTYLSNKN